MPHFAQRTWSRIAWVVTAVLLLAWVFGALTGDGMDGSVDALLILGAVMVLVSVVLGTPRISAAPPPITRTHP